MIKDRGMTLEQRQLAIRGGPPVRSKPLPMEFPGAQHIGEEEIEATARVLRSKSPFRYYGVDLQNEVKSFEDEFARFLAVAHVVAVTSGTGALHVALSALRVGPGQEVIVPSYSWVSIIAAVVNRGAIPVLADIDATFGLDPEDVQKRISHRTTVIVLAHMSGAAGNVQAIRTIAREHNLFLLEDCAQCAGGSVAGRKVGTHGDVGIFSFQLNKNMTAGEGGAVVTNDLNLYRRAVACHDLGYCRDENGRMILDRPELCRWGMGYRMDELRAAVLRVQLRKLPRVIAAMHRSKYRIRTSLAELSGVTLRNIVDTQGDTGCFLITTYQDRPTAMAVNEALRAEGITAIPPGTSSTLMTDWGLHLYYNNLSLVNRVSSDPSGFPWSAEVNGGTAACFQKGACPNADSLFERSILLPIPSCLTEQDEDDIVMAFRKVCAELL